MKCLNLIIMLLAYNEILALPMECMHAFLLYVTRTHTISPFSLLVTLHWNNLKTIIRILSDYLGITSIIFLLSFLSLSSLSYNPSPPLAVLRHYWFFSRKVIRNSNYSASSTIHVCHNCRRLCSICRCFVYSKSEEVSIKVNSIWRTKIITYLAPILRYVRQCRTILSGISIL